MFAGWGKFSDKAGTGDYSPSLLHVVNFKLANSSAFPPPSCKPLCKTATTKTVGEKYGKPTLASRFQTAPQSAAPDIPTTPSTRTLAPVAFPNPHLTCPTAATIQSLLATPTLLAVLSWDSISTTGLQLPAELQVLVPPVLRVIQRAQQDLIPRAADIAMLHETFRSLRPVDERRHVLEDATAFCEILCQVAGSQGSANYYRCTPPLQLGHEYPVPHF